MGTVFLSFLVGFLASIVAAAVFPGLQRWMVAALAVCCGWLPFRQSALFAGVWTVEWHVESTRYAAMEVDPAVRIRQVGKRLFAKFRAAKIDCYLEGKIDGGRYVTGKWYDATEGGYHGSFQLIVDPSTREMAGLWIGFSMSGVVKSGTFKWTRAEAG